MSLARLWTATTFSSTPSRPPVPRKPITVAIGWLAVATWLIASFGAAKAGWTAEAVAPGFAPRDVRLWRQWITTQTMRLRLDVLPSPAAQPSAPRLVTYLIAGSPHSAPKVRVHRLHLYRTRGDDILGETYELPPEIDRSTGLVRVTDLGQFRQFRLYAATVSLAVAASPLFAAAQEMWRVDFLELDVDLGQPAAADARSAARAGEVFAASPRFRLPQALLIDPDLDPAYFVTTATVEWKSVHAWAARVTPPARSRSLFKLNFYAPGLYRVTRQDLAQCAGATSADKQATGGLASARQWRVLARGREIPVIASLQAPDDEMFVVVPRWDVDNDGPTVYWLDASGQHPERTPPQRFEFRDLPLHDSTPRVSRVQCEVVAEKLEDYLSRLHPNAEVTKWYWKSIAPETIGEFDVRLPTILASDANVELIAHVALSLPRQPFPQLELFANGHVLTTTTLSSTQCAVKFVLPGGVLRPGTNALGLGLFYRDDSPEEKRDLLVQKLTFRWQQRANRMPDCVFQLLRATSGPAELILADESGEYLLASIEPGATWAGRWSGGRLYASDVPPVERPLVAQPLAAVPPPASIERIQPPDLALLEPSTGADYLVITPRQFSGALAPLLERRRADGFAVRSVDVEDVFDLFAYGARSAQAIQSFLSFVFYEWPRPKLTHVLLVGEASDYRRDPRDAPAGCQLDLVPTFGSARVESPHGDHAYACVAGTDIVPDLLVGRLSVANADELTSALLKLQRYESAPRGEWAERALFVSDDNEEFPRVAREVAAIAAAPPLRLRFFDQAGFRYVPNIRVYGKRRSREATEALLRSLDDGLAYLVYYGHGGPNLWSHERLLHLQDLPKLTEPSRLPLIACASCDNAWLDYPMPPVKASMGELLVKQPQGGAAAVFAPVSGATPYEHEILMAALTEAIARTPLRSVGELSTYAKIQYFAQALSQAVPQQYVLVGDPATRLRVPELCGMLSVEPQSVLAGQPQSVVVKAEHLPARLTSATVRLTGLAGRDEVLSRPVAVLSGSMAAVLALEGLAPGTYAVVVEGATPEGPVSYAAPLFAEVPRVDLDEQRLWRLAQRPVLTTEPVRAEIALFNPTLLSRTRAHVRASWAPRESDPPATFLQRTLELDPWESWTASFDWTPHLPSRFDVSWAGDWPDAETRELVFRLPRHDNTTSESFVAPLGLRLVAPNPPTEFDAPTIACELWNVGTTPAKDAVANLYLGHEPLAYPQPLTNLAGGAKRQLTFLAKKPLPAGITTVTLRVERKDPTTTVPEKWATLYEQSDRVRIRRGVDLEIVPGSVTTDVPPEGVVARTTVRVRALLRNRGEVPARNVSVQLLLDHPTTGTETLTVNDQRAVTIAEVPAGATVPVEARWENCNDPGKPTLWLVVNRARVIKEANYENNAARVPPFLVRPLGDFRAISLDVAPLAACPATTLSLQFAFSSTADQPRGPLDIEYGLRNPLTGQKKSSLVTVPSVSPNTTSSIARAMTFPGDFTELYAVVNATRELEELDAGGNEVSCRLWPIVDLTSATPHSERFQADLSSDFPRTVSYNVELLPGPVLRLCDTMTSSSGMEPVTPNWVVGGRVVTKPDPTLEMTDNAWSVQPWRIEADRTENCGGLWLRIPAPWPARGILHDVFLYGLASNNYRGGPTGSCGVSVEGATTVTLIWRSDAREGGLQRKFIGRFDLRDEALDIALEQTSGSTVLIKGVEIVPAVGIVESPLYRLPAPSSGGLVLKFVDNDLPPAAITYWVRHASEDGPMILRREWRKVDGHRTQLPPETRVFQWRAELHAGFTPAPVLRRVVLERAH